jgi:endogenous inhibitor of DNA gyrase (YacG/DUF329 family)
MSCPICNKETDKSYRPFCSKRCADIDLGKWLNEEYSVPAEEDEVFSTASEGDMKKDRLAH